MKSKSFYDCGPTFVLVILVVACLWTYLTGQFLHWIPIGIALASFPYIADAVDNKREKKP